MFKLEEYRKAILRWSWKLVKNNVLVIEETHKKLEKMQAKRIMEYDYEEEINLLQQLEFFQTQEEPC